MTRSVALFVLSLAAAAFAGCKSGDTSSPTGPSTTTSNIEYRVTGSSVNRVSLTYQASTGSTQQISSQALPWSFTRTASSGDFLYVSAQIIDGTGSVTVTIFRNGSQFQTATSSGFAAIATASGSTP